MENVKISVIIVTYKQADVIGRNIDSILQQKDYGLHEIIICDDCSPDENWIVINEYVQKYPDIIRAYRNETNLGIYGNSVKAASLYGDADLFCWVEGDDALCDGFFKSSQEYIVKNNINLSEPVGIFADFYSINPEGEKSRIKNDFVLRGESPYGAFLRGKASWRASLFSKSVIKQFGPIELNKGLHLAEDLFDSQWFRFMERAYYNPNTVGSIYYSGVGVSIMWGLSEKLSDYRISENIIKWNYLINHKIITEKEDIYWGKSKIAYSICLKHFSLKYFLQYIIYFIKGSRSYSTITIKSLIKMIYIFLRQKI